MSAAVACLIAIPSTTSGAETAKIEVDGEQIPTEVPPKIEDSRTMVPIRVISENLGAYVDWDGDTKSVLIAREGGTISNPLNQSRDEISLIVNGEIISTDVSPNIVNSRTLVPIRAASEALGSYIQWDGDTNTVRVFTDFNQEEDKTEDDTEDDKKEDDTQEDLESPEQDKGEDSGQDRDTDTEDENDRNDYDEKDRENEKDNKEDNEKDDPEQDVPEDDEQIADNWTLEDYNNYNTSNFRENELFHQSVDFDNLDYPRLNAAIFYVTNEIRAEHNLSELKHTVELEIAAWNHSKSMAEQEFFSHNNSYNSDRYSPSDRGELAGILNPSIAENIAMSSFYDETYLSMAENILDMWMDSEGHRDNILSENAIQLGTGAYDRGGQAGQYGGATLYFTQKFQWYQEVESTDSTDPSPHQY